MPRRRFLKRFDGNFKIKNSWLFFKWLQIPKKPLFRHFSVFLKAHSVIPLIGWLNGLKCLKRGFFGICYYLKNNHDFFWPRKLFVWEVYNPTYWRLHPGQSVTNYKQLTALLNKTDSIIYVFHHIAQCWVSIGICVFPWNLYIPLESVDCLVQKMCLKI